MKLLLLFFLVTKPIIINDIRVNEPPHFIAMEYKGFSNCIYKVYITDSLIMCAKVNGYITVEPNFGIGTTIPKTSMHNPEAYVDSTMAAKYPDLPSDIPGFLKANNQNFIIRKKDIADITFNPQKKWGMGYYPHNGRVIVKVKEKVYNNKTEREFILIGDQNPEEVLTMLKK